MLQLQMKNSKENIFQTAFTNYAVKFLLLFCSSNVEKRRNSTKSSGLLYALLRLQHEGHTDFQYHFSVKLLVRVGLSYHTE